MDDVLYACIYAYTCVAFVHVQNQDYTPNFNSVLVIYSIACVVNVLVSHFVSHRVRRRSLLLDIGHARRRTMPSLKLNFTLHYTVVNPVLGSILCKRRRLLLYAHYQMLAEKDVKQLSQFSG